MELQGDFRSRKCIPSVVISPALPRSSTPTPNPNPALRISKAYIMAPNLPPGARKGKGMEVNISGFYGMHLIETGIAYWYRGHYMYSTAGIPVEPIPFATKKGIHIVGTTVDTAPPFRPGDMLNSRHEREVAALYRSMVHTWEERDKEDREEKRDVDTGACGAQTYEVESLAPAYQRVNRESELESELAW
jgi:hypothetical protein